MPNRRKGGSRKNGGSPSRPIHQVITFRDLDPDKVRRAMLASALLSAEDLGMDIRTSKPVIISSPDVAEVFIYTPGKVGFGSDNMVLVNPMLGGTVMVGFAPNASKDEGLPGALLCSRYFEGEPTFFEVHETAIERWNFEEYLNV